MTLQGWMQIGLTLLTGFLLSIPVGRYLATVVMGRKTVFDRLFDPVDNVIYSLIGRWICGQAMDWKTYTLHMLATNLVMAVIIFLILVFQDHLVLNPQHFAGMEPMLAFNTAVSFITNTDWQGYGGETTLSNFSQMAAITFPMFTSATTGFVVAMAFIRAFTVKDRGADLGNFYRDLIRFTTRVLLPVAIVLALVLIQQGEPQTLAANAVAHTVEGGDQTIALGPVASLETIKHLGTNGGGFFNANAAHPFENPTPITNLVQALLMIVLPSSIVLCFGEMIGNRRQGWVLYGVMSVMLIMFLPVIVVPEQAGTPLLAKAGIEMSASASQSGGNMEGKEVRFGIAESGLFAGVTTLFTTGSVNSMHDSYTPIGGMGIFIGMMLQCVFGGKGVGFLNALVYGIIAVFVAGLMVGRTPEFLGKKIEKPEIVLVSLTLLIHPLVILASYGLVGGRALRRCADGQRWNPWLFRSALCVHEFRRQQRFRLRRTECQYALVQSGHCHRHPHRPLSADYLHDGGGRIASGEADGAGHARNSAYGHLQVRNLLARHHPGGGRTDILPCARAGTGR